MWRHRAPNEGEAMSTPKQPTNTTAFFVQAGVSFGLALLSLLIGVLYLEVDPWVRAFLGLAVVFLTTSAFTLAKCVRDHQESSAIYQRIDQARVDKILSEHDPFQNPV
jgi:hypothetical protein